ncbi:hypothetical protein J6590_022636 [Homalodisca vitripennis]|nr:hypothetical protein J6590_022636 [Homalodisca vitripennis]
MLLTAMNCILKRFRKTCKPWTESGIPTISPPLSIQILKLPGHLTNRRLVQRIDEDEAVREVESLGGNGEDQDQDEAPLTVTVRVRGQGLRLVEWKRQGRADDKAPSTGRYNSLHYKVISNSNGPANVMLVIWGTKLRACGRSGAGDGITYSEQVPKLARTVTRGLAGLSC